MTKLDDYLIHFDIGLVGVIDFEGRLQASDGIIVVFYALLLLTRLVRVKINSVLT